MKIRSFDELLGLLMVLVPGGVGAFVVMRTLATYWERDALATLIVAVIAAALGLGLWELLVRLARAGQLERDLRQLPKTASEGMLDSASPLLGSMLRARLEHAPLPSFGEGIAPFLTGLLVMLGLLGTLLGLFQTVAGAGHALTSSGDIDALRRSLSAPIAGLTRSFGCSAAGISASAMLGLALALVRRREARVLRSFNVYAAGPLQVLSPARRQLRALEQLASQGSAMPAAAAALEAAGTTMGQLSEQLTSLQETALKAQQRAFGDVLATMRGEFAKAAGETGEALSARVSPLLEQLAARSGEALLAQAGALADVTRELTRELERDAAQRREQAAEAMQALYARLDEAERTRSAAHSAELEAMTSAAARSLSEAEARERALGERWRELIERFDAQLAAAERSERERLQGLAEQAQLGREQDAERLARLDGLSQRAGAELERLSSALSAQLEQRLASERSQDERAERVFSQLSAAAEAVTQSSAGHERAFAQAVQGLPALFDAAAQSSQRAAQEALNQLAELTEQRLARVSSLLTDELEQRSASTRAADERSAAALERAQRSAEQLEAAIARQGEALEGLVARVNGLLPELADAAQSGAAGTIERVRELAEQQAARFAELEAGLQNARDQHAEGLAQQISSHASELEQRLERTSAAVQEAAAIWQASSAEMQAVAELFANSVERQREASDAWLESLGQIDGAVERAGRHAARDALAEQLASTQEVFTRQLQFQRELFEQLRTLRGSSPARATGGEADVSV